MQEAPVLRPLALDEAESSSPQHMADPSLRASTHAAPSLGLHSFGGDIFDPYGNPGQLRRLKRTRLLLGVVSGLLFVGVVLLLTALYSYENRAAIVEPDGGFLGKSKFENSSAKIDLDLDLDNNHGACMAQDGQGLTLYMNGIPVAQGSGHCHLEFLDKSVRAPQCRNRDTGSMSGQNMWIAIEAHDAELNMLADRSKGGFQAAMEWCGLEIVTDKQWKCSMVAGPNWEVGWVLVQPADTFKLIDTDNSGTIDRPEFEAYKTRAPGGWLQEVEFIAIDKDRDGTVRLEEFQKGAANKMNNSPDCEGGWCSPKAGPDPWPPARVIGVGEGENVIQLAEDMPELGTGPEWIGKPKTSQWIWMGGSREPSQAQLVGVDTVYCRRKVSCDDQHFHAEAIHLGYSCEAGASEQQAEQVQEDECEHKEGGEKEPKCTPGLFFSSENFLEGIGGACLMCYMFVAFHLLCDDFFVPALNVLCEVFSIPDDIAGATFMAAGASSPELFSSLIGVLKESDVGVGTVVGSEMFNLLIIIGGVCLVIDEPTQLDWRTLVREVLAFTASLVGILLVLKDSEVHLYEAITLVCCYAVYVLVMAQYSKIVAALCPISTGDGAFEDEFLGDFSDAAVTDRFQSFRLPSFSGALTGGGNRLDMLSQPMVQQQMKNPLSPQQAYEDMQASGQMNGAMFGMDYGEVLMHGFLFKKSEFYSKVRNAAHAWDQRWVVLDENKLYYRQGNRKEQVLVRSQDSWTQAMVRKISYTEFELATIRGRFIFRAAKPAMAQMWVRAIVNRIEHFKMIPPLERQTSPRGGDEMETVDDHVHNLLAVPETIGGKLWFLFTLPLRICFKFTLIDVRNAHLTKWFPLTLVAVIVWMAILAEFMMTGAETAGCIMGIEEAVMGLTVSAAGTSLPNLFASMIVAKQGLSNMAVSNAFGSNTFNIFIALAVPWMVGAIIQGQADGPCSLGYMYPVPATSIFSSCLILAGVLVLLVGMIVGTGFKLLRPMGYFFYGVYIIILGYLMTSS